MKHLFFFQSIHTFPPRNADTHPWELYPFENQCYKMSGEQREGVKAMQRTILWDPEKKRRESLHETTFLNDFLAKQCSQKWLYVLSLPVYHTH